MNKILIPNAMRQIKLRNLIKPLLHRHKFLFTPNDSSLAWIELMGQIDRLEIIHATK